MNEEIQAEAALSGCSCRARDVQKLYVLRCAIPEGPCKAATLSRIVGLRYVGARNECDAAAVGLSFMNTSINVGHFHFFLSVNPVECWGN